MSGNLRPAAEMQMGIAAQGSIRIIAFRRFIHTDSIGQAINRIRMGF